MSGPSRSKRTIASMPAALSSRPSERRYANCVASSSSCGALSRQSTQLIADADDEKQAVAADAQRRIQEAEATAREASEEAGAQVREAESRARALQEEVSALPSWQTALLICGSS